MLSETNQIGFQFRLMSPTSFKPLFNWITKNKKNVGTIYYLHFNCAFYSIYLIT